MPAFDYKNLQACVTRAQERSGVSDPDLISELLEDTAGRDLSGNTVYRPYWVAAVLLDQKRRDVKTAEGATFRDVESNITAMKRHQWSIDEMLGTIVAKVMTRYGSSTYEVRTRVIPITQDA